jgi:hypothetical protein
MMSFAPGHDNTAGRDNAVRRRPRGGRASVKLPMEINLPHKAQASPGPYLSSGLYTLISI